MIPILYDEAEDCSHGKCHVRKGEHWLYLDKNGKEIKRKQGIVSKEEFTSWLK